MRLPMALMRALLVALLLAAPGPIFAAGYTDTAALDELFSELKAAPNAAEADTIVQEIWKLWFAPDNVDLADRMLRASASMNNSDYPGALSLLTGVVTDFPDYAEGWNQRATLYYIMGDFDASLADIDKVLALEPRHFGALSGRVLIYLKQGKRDEALKDMMAALAIDPYLSEKSLFPELAPNVTHV
jgi:tetratricopeptide (TPR) repeat protein